MGPSTPTRGIRLQQCRIDQQVTFFLEPWFHPLTPIGALTPETRDPPLTIDEIEANLQEAKVQLSRAQGEQRIQADRHRRPAENYQSGELIWLSSANIKQRNPTAQQKKLRAKWIGPFQVTHHVSDVNYRLELPVYLRIHNVFHSSLLKRYHEPAPGAKVLPGVRLLRIVHLH